MKSRHRARWGQPGRGNLTTPAAADDRATRRSRSWTSTQPARPAISLAQMSLRTYEKVQQTAGGLFEPILKVKDDEGKGVKVDLGVFPSGRLPRGVNWPELGEPPPAAAATAAAACVAQTPAPDRCAPRVRPPTPLQRDWPLWPTTWRVWCTSTAGARAPTWLWTRACTTPRVRVGCWVLGFLLGSGCWSVGGGWWMAG